jgi:hypothetical protein
MYGGLSVVTKTVCRFRRYVRWAMVVPRRVPLPARTRVSAGHNRKLSGADERLRYTIEKLKLSKIVEKFFSYYFKSNNWTGLFFTFFRIYIWRVLLVLRGKEWVGGLDNNFPKVERGR